jgi:hypothetical protein
MQFGETVFRVVQPVGTAQRLQIGCETADGIRGDVRGRAFQAVRQRPHAPRVAAAMLPRDFGEAVVDAGVELLQQPPGERLVIHAAREERAVIEDLRES